MFEFLVCAWLASMLMTIRPISDAIHALKGAEPPHVTKAKVRAERERERLAAERARLENRRVRPGEDKPTFGDLLKVYWGDAMADAIVLHNRRRAVKQEKRAAGQDSRRSNDAWWKSAGRGWRLFWDDVLDMFRGDTGKAEPRPSADSDTAGADDTRNPGEAADAAEEPEPGPTEERMGPDVAQSVAETLNPDSPAAPGDGPRIACDECAATLIDTEGGYAHPPGSTCPKVWPAAVPPQVRQPDQPATPAPARTKAATTTQPAVADPGGGWHWTCRHCGAKSLTEYESLNASTDAYYREHRCPKNDGKTWPPDTKTFFVCTRCGFDSGRIYPDGDTAFAAGRTHQCPPSEFNKGDDMTAETATTPTATGDVHDVESGLHECGLLADDLARIDAALDTIDEAITNAASAAEGIEAFLASKNVEASAVGGMSAARERLSPERIKELIDAVDAAKAGVQRAEDELRRLQDLEQQLAGADGSVLNGR